MNSVAGLPVMEPAVLLGVCARETLPPAPAAGGMTCSARSANSDTMRAGHSLFIAASAEHQPSRPIGGELKSGFQASSVRDVPRADELRPNFAAQAFSASEGE